jgi:hypothetical protein
LVKSSPDKHFKEIVAEFYAGIVRARRVRHGPARGFVEAMSGRNRIRSDLNGKNGGGRG